MATKWNDIRPLSPHLQIWKWHPAMLASILHRACGIITYIALIKVGVGLLVLALTGSLPLESLIFSPVGAFAALIGVFSVTFMALAQLRHAFWDQGKLFAPDLNNTLSWGMIALALVVTVLFGLIIAG